MSTAISPTVSKLEDRKATSKTTCRHPSDWWSRSPPQRSTRVVDIFLALRDVNPPGCSIGPGHRGYEVGQSVGHPPDTLHCAFALRPTAVAVRCALSESFFGPQRSTLNS